MPHAKHAILPVLLAIVCLAPAAQAGQPVSAGIPPVGSPAPRTPWGVPDLTGVWDHGTTTPMQRPARHEGREFLTAEEIAEANLNARTFATSERRSELSAERDVGLAYTWERPWTAALDMPRTNGLLYEYACHERNYGMENLLLGARALERAAATK